MHYRQTIIDTATAALEPLPSLGGRVSSRNFYAVPESPAARVYVFSEELPSEQWVSEPKLEARVLQLRITIMVSSNNSQSDMNGVLEEVEGVMGTALDGVADCARQIQQEWTFETDQDNESLAVNVDYAVWYTTAIGDPANRV